MTKHTGTSSPAHGADQKQRKGVRRTITKVFRGQVVSSDFFARHWLPVLVILILLMVNITGKYVCQTRMEQINKLNRELEIVKAESVRVRSLYMGRTCESSMQQLVDSMHLGLNVAERPPFKLTSR